MCLKGTQITEKTWDQQAGIKGKAKRHGEKKNIRFWWKDKEERNVEVRCRVEQAGLASCLLPLMWE